MGAGMTVLPRIGYAPINARFNHPGDIRRFAGYARARNLPIELARPDQRYDLVVVSEIADVPVWADYRGGKVVFDLIDSYLAIPRGDPKQLLRGLVWYANGRHSRLRFDFKGALEAMCARADAVVCTTEEQRSDIGRFCPNVHIVLDIHDNVVRSRKEDYAASEPFRLVWEGLPSNVPQLNAIGSVLREVAKRRPLALHVVTDSDRPGVVPGLRRIKSADVARKVFDDIVLDRWEASTLSDKITQCDAAIIPIFTNDPMTRGKPGNKLALLWRMGMPVITSATPSYRHMQEAAGTPYLACANDADWLAALEKLMSDEAARRDAGERGHRYVTEHLSTAQLLALWDGVFSSVGFDFHRPGV
jgi:glycosyltransferase involved in cell wall biosynthesis